MKSKKHFTKYLTEDLGFKSYRKVGNEYIENNINDFSTMQEGGIDIRYIKDGIEIVWGLHEFKKPPTLIYPRPNVSIKTKLPNDRTHCEYGGDDAMNLCLKKELPEKIYEAMFNKNIKFVYEK